MRASSLTHAIIPGSTLPGRGDPGTRPSSTSCTRARRAAFAAVTDRLASLKDLGITAIELMPIADFPGKSNWGYDGVLPYAPDTAYGTPEELKALIDAAHGMDMMVLLDVVYNHFGPDGNYLHAYAEQFFRTDFKHPGVRRSTSADARCATSSSRTRSTG